MFKEMDNMRPAATPERVLAICRLLERESYSLDKLYQLCELKKETFPDEIIRSSIDTAEELGIILKKNNEYFLNVSSNSLESAENFRREIVPIIFSMKNSTFFKMTEWFVVSAEKAMTIKGYDELAAEAAKDGVPSITENGVLGWRFWIRFVGHAYIYNKTLIPNMKIRIEDAMIKLKSGSSMTCTQFVTWIKENIPEAASSCSVASLAIGVSNGLRTLQNEGKIDFLSTKDAIRTSLYPIKGMECNDFSDIIINEVGL